MVLVDNSRSMQPYKAEVTSVLRNMAFILGKADPDGLDVALTFESEKIEHNRRTEKLVEFVEGRFQKGAQSRCFIGASLQALVNRILKDLPENAGEKQKSRIQRFMSSKKRPVSLYVLTNGIWDPSAREGVCGAHIPIMQLMTELRNRNLERSQVAIQFIRFGDDPVGVKRLNGLDNLVKDHESLSNL